METPLAERIRPQKLEDYISQLHLVGPNGSLTKHKMLLKKINCKIKMRIGVVEPHPRYYL